MSGVQCVWTLTLIICHLGKIAELMIMANHQIFSDQFKLDNVLYIINAEVSEFTLGKHTSGQFSTLVISTEIVYSCIDCDVVSCVCVLYTYCA